MVDFAEAIMREGFPAPLVSFMSCFIEFAAESTRAFVRLADLADFSDDAMPGRHWHQDRLLLRKNIIRILDATPIPSSECMHYCRSYIPSGRLEIGVSPRTIQISPPWDACTRTSNNPFPQLTCEDVVTRQSAKQRGQGVKRTIPGFKARYCEWNFKFRMRSCALIKHPFAREG